MQKKRVRRNMVTPLRDSTLRHDGARTNSPPEFPVNQEGHSPQENAADSAGITAEVAAERRVHTRIPVSLGVDIVDTTTGVSISGRATDFGVGGCYVDTMNTFAEGTPVDVYLSWQECKLKLRALVSYAVNGRSIGMGLSFTGTSAQAGATLLDLLTGAAGPPFQKSTAQPPTPAAPAKSGDPARPLDLQPVVKVLERLLILLVQRGVINKAERAELLSRLLR